MIPPRLRHALPFVMLLAGAVVVAGVGCKTGSGQQADRHGCEEGTYWDIRSKTCRTPSLPSDAQVLGNYRRFEEIASATPTDELQVQLNFSKYLSKADFEALLADPSILGVDSIILYLPSYRGGYSIPVRLAKPTPVIQAISQAFVELERTDGDWIDPDGRRFGDVLRRIQDSNDYLLGVARVDMTSASSALSFWELQASIVRLAQPILGSRGISTPSFQPTEAIR